MTEETTRPEFKALIDSKPSRAITAMLDGLEKQDASDNFEVAMGTFGEVQHLKDGVVCFGCAATCAIVELLPADPMEYVVKRCSVNFSSPYDYEGGPSMFDFLIFEDVMDQLRLGRPRRLLDYCGLSYDDSQRVVNLQSCSDLEPMEAENWRGWMPIYRRFAADLERMGL